MRDLDARSLQERFAPASVCFGCGPANRDGLGLRSFPDPHRTDGLVATWMPSPHHHAFANVLNGGIVGALMDCHANWAAAMALMRASGADLPPPPPAPPPPPGRAARSSSAPAPAVTPETSRSPWRISVGTRTSARRPMAGGSRGIGRASVWPAVSLARLMARTGSRAAAATRGGG